MLAMKRILLAFRPLAIILVVLVVIWYALSRFNASREEYRQFVERRQAWHERCDVYRTTPSSTAPAAQMCAKELEELTALARSRGWSEK